MQKTFFISWVSLFVLILFTGAGNADKKQVNENGIVALIELSNTQKDQTIFTSTLENHQSAKAEFHYRLNATKNGASGQSNSSQSGSTKVSPGEKVNLSTVSLNLSKKDTWTIELAIYQNDMLIGGDTLKNISE